MSASFSTARRGRAAEGLFGAETHTNTHTPSNHEICTARLASFCLVCARVLLHNMLLYRPPTCLTQCAQPRYACVHCTRTGRVWLFTGGRPDCCKCVSCHIVLRRARDLVSRSATLGACRHRRFNFHLPMQKRPSGPFYHISHSSTAARQRTPSKNASLE